MGLAEVQTRYPTLETRAGIFSKMMMGGMGAAFFPMDAGPFQKVLYLMDFGLWLVPGIGTAIKMATMLGSALGYGLPDLGRWMDEHLGYKDFGDLANLVVTDDLTKLLGGLKDEALNKLQQLAVAAGIVEAPKVAEGSIWFPLIKVADADLDAAEAAVKKLSPKQQAELAKRQMEKGPSLGQQSKTIENYDNVKKAREKYDATKEGSKAQERAGEKLGRERAKGQARYDHSQKGRLQKAFAPKGERMKTVGQAFKKGWLGGLVIAFTNTLVTMKDIAIKVATKFPKLSLLLGATAAVASIASASFVFSGDKEPKKVGTTKGSIFSPSMDNVISEVGESKGISPQREPKTFEEKIAFQVNMISQSAMSG